jgi:predicted dehydrogenase
MDGDGEMTKLRLAVAGAGLIGKRHIEMIRNSGECELSAIVDPFPQAADYANELNVPVFVPRRPLRSARPRSWKDLPQIQSSGAWSS